MNGCVYRTDTDRCGLFTTETVTSFCPVNWVEKCPCRKQSNADKIRHSTDEEIAEMVAKEIAYLPGTIFEWLKQEAKEGE